MELTRGSGDTRALVQWGSLGVGDFTKNRRIVRGPVSLRSHLTSTLGAFEASFKGRPARVGVGPRFADFLFPVFFRAEGISFLSTPIPSFENFPIEISRSMRCFRVA